MVEHSFMKSFSKLEMVFIAWTSFYSLWCSYKSIK